MNNYYNIRSIQELLVRQRDNASTNVYGEEKSSLLHLIDLQRMQKEKISRNGYPDTKRAQCVLWIAEGYENSSTETSRGEIWKESSRKFYNTRLVSRRSVKGEPRTEGQRWVSPNKRIKTFSVQVPN